MGNIKNAPCLSFSIPAVQLPPIFAPTFGITISFPPPPTLPSIPCCKFTLPSFTLPIPLPPLPIGPILAALNAILAAAFALLPTVQVPSCNL